MSDSFAETKARSTKMALGNGNREPRSKKNTCKQRGGRSRKRQEEKQRKAREASLK